jgi:DNA-binding LacI/PurR family transcriptional regulator
VQELTRRHVSFDALFAASDLAAIGAMKALQEQGRRVPEDVAVVGFDDLAAAGYASPPLTTVAQDAKAAGSALVEALIERVEGRTGEPCLLPVTLKVRGSSVG